MLDRFLPCTQATQNGREGNVTKRGTNLFDNIQLRRWISARTVTRVLRYRLRASQDDERIEHYPGITLAEARKPAGKLRLAIGHGGNQAARAVL